MFFLYFYYFIVGKNVIQHFGSPLAATYYTMPRKKKKTINKVCPILTGSVFVVDVDLY